MGATEPGTVQSIASPSSSTTSDQPATIRENIRRLSAAQKPSAGVAPYGRWVNRPLGRVFAAVAARWGLTPNIVTTLSACCTFPALALVALARPTPFIGIAVAALLLLGYALDAADGQLARLLGRSSHAGEWLDHVVDAAKVSVLHATVLISFFRFTDVPDWQLLIAVGYQALSSVLFFGMILIDQLRRSVRARSGAGTAPNTPARKKSLQAVLATPGDYAVLCMCFALLGWESVFRVGYNVLFAFNVMILLVAGARWWREVRGFDRTAL